MLDTLKAAVLVAHFRSPFRLLALLPALISLVVPVAAWGDIYKWTDERGTTVYSNIAPTTSGKVRNVELLVKEARPAANALASIPEHVATPTEQALLAKMQTLERQLQAPQGVAQAPKVPAHGATPAEQVLLARIETLERQLQAQQYAAQAPAVPSPTSYSGYYPPAPPPPPPSSSYYDSGYDSSDYYSGGYDSGYYPSYYPSYTYPVVSSYSYAAYPARTYIRRPVFAAPHGGSFLGGGGHRGRR